LFRTGLAVTVEFAISTIGNSAGPIGAGYVIINELALTRAGCDRTAFPLALRTRSIELSEPRPPRGSSSLSSRPGVRRERCTAFSAKGILRSAKRESIVTTQALMRGTRSSGMGKIIAVATGQDKNPWPFGQIGGDLSVHLSEHG
jgi:hypothetical protein